MSVSAAGESAFTVMPKRAARARREREPDDAALGRGIGREAGHTVHAGTRCDVDDTAPPCLLHPRHELTDQAHRPGEVHRETAIPLVVGEPRDRAAHRDGRVFTSTSTVPTSSSRATARGPSRGRRPPRRSPPRSAPPPRPRRRPPRAGRARSPVRPPRRTAVHRTPDAARRAGDERDVPCEQVHDLTLQTLTCTTSSTTCVSKTIRSWAKPSPSEGWTHSPVLTS